MRDTEAVLARLNEYAADAEKYEQGGCPQVIYEAIAALILVAERYEKLRRLNPRYFNELHRRNLAGENFDELVDKII